MLRARGSGGTVLELAHPWLLLLLPAPLLVWRFAPPYRHAEEALQAPFFARIAEATGQTPQEGAVVRRRSVAMMILGIVVWCLLVVALAAPQWVEPPITKTLAARDLMLAVDLSGSMGEEDFVGPDGAKVDRLTAVKQVVGEFIERRESDRIGLIVFGNAAYVQAPFSQDHEIVRYLLDETRVAMAGPMTMMGDAIGLAIPRFDESASRNRVMILLTDGNDTGSKMPPEKAAQIAKRSDVTIHTIAIGDPESVGENPLDEATLRAIADTTGGGYFHAGDRSELEAAYAKLDELEPGQVDTLSYRPRTALFHWPAGVAALLLAGWHVVSAMPRRKRRAHA